jgi:hypothetical protein
VFTVVAWPIERFGHPELRLFQGDVSPFLVPDEKKAKQLASAVEIHRGA